MALSCLVGVVAVGGRGVAGEGSWVSSLLLLPEALLHAHRNKIKGLDSNAWIDVAFMNHVAGEGGQRALETMVLQVMPDETTEIDIAACIVKIQALKDGELFRMSCEAAQGAVSSAVNLLDDVHCRRRPERSQAATKFMGMVWDRLPWFVSQPMTKTGEGAAVASTAGPEEMRVVRGVDAVRLQWEEIKALKDVSLEKFQWVGPLSHYLPESEQKLMSDMITRILRGAPVSTGGKSKPAKPAAAKSRKAKEDPDARLSAAKAILGL